jgi:hypothetical protein
MELLQVLAESHLEIIIDFRETWEPIKLTNTPTRFLLASTLSI